MNVPFPPEELEQRRAAMAAVLERHGLDGLLCFRPESRYWLGGDEPSPDFECLLIDTAGATVLLTREPDVADPTPRARLTGERHHWDDGADDPIAELRSVLEARGLAGERLGVEYAGLAGDDARRVDSALGTPDRAQDASDLVTRLRAIKSPGEMACLRRAAGLADDAVDAVLASAAPGAWEGDIAAAVAGAIPKGGGSVAGDILARPQDPDAAACGGLRHLDLGDELALEWAGAYRRYRMPVARTLAVGEAAAELNELHALAVGAMAAAVAACMPGARAGAVFDAQARVIDAAAGQVQCSVACGHGLGATFGTSVDWPVLRGGNNAVIESGMALLLRIALADPATGRRVLLGQSVEISEAGAVPLQRRGSELLAV